MSNSLAIAAVTATIRNLLFAGVNADVPGTTVGTGPPDRVRTNGQDNRLNLFLYHTSLDPAWRNQPLPGVSRDGEDGRPPLPLSLYYLVTAYGENDDGIVSHRLLGKAMSVLHDHPVLDGAEIKAAVGAANIAESDLDQQIERVRITPQPLTLEEMSKLWTTFQTQYRISAAYQACVVLIESRMPTRAPLPVLTRGDVHDVGVVAQPSTLPPFPTIEDVVPPNGQPSAVLGDPVLLSGHNLEGTTSVRVVHVHLGTRVSIPPPPLDEVLEARVGFHLPGEPTNLLAGLCSVTGVASVPGEPDRLTNEAPLQVAPKVTAPNAVRDAAGVVTITLTCSPKIVPGQRVSLLLGEHQIPLAPIAAATSTPVFTTPKLDPGTYLLRLRVDGVDSLLVDRSKTPPVFDPSQKLVVP